jgi:hypothetical protein
MTSEEKDDVEGTIANLMAQIERIRETYAGEAAPREPAPPKKPPVRTPAPPPAPAPPVTPPLAVPTQAESVRAFIAVFVVFFGLGAIVFAWLTMGIDDAQRLAAILLGVIATVVGYYFGQRGTTRAQMQAGYAMNGWQAADARVRQLEDWMRQPER